MSMLLLSACSATTDCCREEFGVSHALIYGIVRSANGQPVVGAPVHSTVNGNDTVSTTGGGLYRLPLSFPGLGPGVQHATVNVFPPNYRPGIDSVTKATFVVQAFAAQPPADSTRVDVTLVPGP